MKNSLLGIVNIEVGLLAERAEVVYDKRVTDVWCNVPKRADSVIDPGNYWSD